MHNNAHSGNKGGIMIAIVRLQYTNAWRRKTRTARIGFIAACLVLGALGNSASAVDYLLTNSGNWTTPTIWTPNGVPTAGDSIDLAQVGYTLSVTGSQSFGSTTVTSHLGFVNIVTGGGTLNHVAGSTFKADFSGNWMTNLTFNNAGVYLQNGFTVRFDNTTFNNQASGFIRGAGRIRAGTVNNLGTMEITDGVMDFDNAPATTMLSISQGGASLDYGTYRVLGHSASATLGLTDALASDFGLTSVGEITNIGASATVVLSSTGLNTANFTQLGAVGSVSGKFLLHGTKSHTNSASGTTVSGTIGGDGTFVAPGGVNLTGGTIDIKSFAGGFGDLNVAGNVTLNSASSLLMDLGGTTPGSLFDQLVVNGSVDLGSSLLYLTTSFEPVVGDTFILIDNDDIDGVAGTFQGLPENAFIDISSGGNDAFFRISYVGGTGNDVMLTATIPEPSTVLLLLGAGVLVWRRGTR